MMQVNLSTDINKNLGGRRSVAPLPLVAELFGATPIGSDRLAAFRFAAPTIPTALDSRQGWRRKAETEIARRFVSG